jgi:radical SAM protein with 4Fe4S-binding SPASM domain
LDAEEFKIGFADNYGRGKNDYNDEFVQKQKEAMKTIDKLRRINKGKIKIRDAYIAKLHGYKRDNDDLLKYVYRGALSCGAGSEDLVISSEGKIRPCHFFPEDIFSIPSENALYEHIHGNFHVDYLQKAIAQYIDMRKKDNYELCRGMCGTD